MTKRPKKLCFEAMEGLVRHEASVRMPANIRRFATSKSVVWPLGLPQRTDSERACARTEVTFSRPVCTGADAPAC